MRLRRIDAAKKEFPVQRLCKVLGVSQSGYFARKDRPACRRPHEDMALLAHIRWDCQESCVSGHSDAEGGRYGSQERHAGPTSG